MGIVYRANFEEHYSITCMSGVILSVIHHKGKRAFFPVQAIKAYTGVEI